MPRRSRSATGSAPTTPTAPTCSRERAGRRTPTTSPGTAASAGGKTLTGGAVIYWWLEIIAVLTYYFVYSAVRNADAAHPERAFQHAKQLIGWQKTLGIYHELAIHKWALQHRAARSSRANYFYGSLHFVVTIGVAVFLFRKFPDDYPRWRNTLAIATAIALIGFRFWPLMPPRLLPHSLRLRRHARQVPDVLELQLGRDEEDLQPVRGDAERPLLLGAVVRVRAGAPAQALVGEVARRALPGAHGRRSS